MNFRTKLGKGQQRPHSDSAQGHSDFTMPFFIHTKINLFTFASIVIEKPRDSGVCPLSRVLRYPTRSADHPAHSSSKEERGHGEAVLQEEATRAWVGEAGWGWSGAGGGVLQRGVEEELDGDPKKTRA